MMEIMAFDQQPHKATLIPPSVLPDEGYASCHSMKTGPLTLYISYVCYGVSIAYIVVFSILERRSNRQRSRCPGNRPGVIFPVNLLDHHDDPLTLAASFGSLTGIFFDLFFSVNAQNQLPYWATTLLLLMTVILVGVIYYPLFAALSTTRILLGSIFGFCLSVLWLIFYLVTVVYCPNGDTEKVDIPGMNIAVLAPVILCFLFLAGKFLIRIISDIVAKIRSRSYPRLEEQTDRRYLATNRNRMHVRLLMSATGGNHLTDQGTMATEYWTARARRLFQRWIYLPDPSFEYSPRIIAVFTVAILCTYQIGILIVLGTKHIHSLASDMNNNAYNASDINGEFFMQIKLFLDTFSYSAAISFVVASLVITWSIFKILTNYRRDIRRMYKGDFSTLPFTRNDRHSQLTLTDNLMYAGAQVGYMLWGFLVTFVMLLITCIALSYLIILPLTDRLPKTLLYVIANLLSGMVVSPAFYLLLMLCARFMLQSVQGHDTNWRSVRVLAIDNRKIYHNVQYFLFFFNIVLGVFGALLNIVKSIVLGILYLPRLDRCGLIPGFERWDVGYMDYVSMLHVEECHRHPVMLVFCDLLIAAAESRVRHTDTNLRRYGSEDMPSPTYDDNEHHTRISAGLSVSSRLTRNRWLKAYTLLRNPCVRVKDSTNTCDDSLNGSLSVLQNAGTNIV